MHGAWLSGRDRPPRIPGDLEDDHGDDEADDRIRDLGAERNDGCACHDAEGDEPVDPRVVSVCDESRAREPLPGPQPNLSGDLVPDEADHPGGSKYPQMCEVLRVDEAHDRLVQRYAGTDEDREDDRQTREFLTPERPEEERDPERHCGQRIAVVVDQVGEERDRPREDEHDRLSSRGDPEDCQADRDGLDAFARADD